MKIKHQLVQKVVVLADYNKKTLYSPKEFCFELFGNDSVSSLRVVRHFLKTDQIQYLRSAKRYYIPHAELIRLRGQEFISENIEYAHESN